MSSGWLKPRAVRTGDTLGVCAPSGPVDPEQLARGVRALHALGFEVRVADGVLERRGFTAGGVELRLTGLLSLFEDETVAGVVCARGGAGAIQLLPRLELDRILAHPKPFVGYSDVTFLHALLNNAGRVTVHGPMLARGLADGRYHRQSLLAALSGSAPPYQSEEDELLPLRPGVAEGRLLGGCLSILAAAAGTPWALRAPADEDVVLLLEDVDEAPYRIDRMLRQLRGCGLFERVRGLVLGDFPGCSPPIDQGFTLPEVILEALSGLAMPVALGLSTGHTRSPIVSVPLGVRARLECDGERARFSVLEPAVA